MDTRNHTIPLYCCSLALVSAFVGALTLPPNLGATPPTDLSLRQPADYPSVELGPVSLDPAVVGIGRRVAPVTLKTLDGETLSLREAGGKLGTVVIVRDPDCPVSRQYGHRIARFASVYGTQGFGFVFIYPNVSLEEVHRRSDQETLGVSGTFVDNGSFALAEALGVNSTGDTFVLDAEGQLRYRGAIDDQFGIGFARTFPTRNYLRDAIEAVGAGNRPTPAATSAPGCHVDAEPGVSTPVDAVA